MNNLYIHMVIFSLLMFLHISLSAQNEIYVSLRGNDQNTGTFNKPVQTITKAVELSLSNASTSKIYLREGNYTLDKTLELTSAHLPDNRTLHIAAYKNERVSINGGRIIPEIAIESISSKENKYFNRGDIDYIKKIDLKKQGITNYGKIKNVGFLRPYTTAPLELFINKKAFHFSRYPNKGNIPMGKVLDPGSMPSKKDYRNRGGKFHYSDDRPSRWTKSKDVWICGYFNKGWAEDAIQVAEFDTINKTITTAQPHHYGFGTGAKWKQWYAFNILEEIDEPGEFYLDRDNGVLYFYPFPNQEIESVEVSILEEPLVALENTTNVTFSNITFENSRGMGVYIEGGENHTFDNCTFRNLGGTAICFGKGATSDYSQTEELQNQKLLSRQMGSLNAFVYANTAVNRKAGTNHTIQNCVIYDVGAGGIILDGGDRKSLSPGNNRVINCKIHDFNRIEKSYRPGIWIRGVGNTIANCEIFNAPMMAIWLHGNEHIIEYCDFHDVVRDMHDQGAIYYGRDPSERGNTIRYNYFHDLGNEHLSVSVYHDDGACDMTVHGNIFYKAGSMPVLIGGGHDHTYTNNIFIDCPIGIHVDNRKQGWAKGSGEKGGAWQFEKRLNVVDFQNPPYSTKYPDFPDYWKNEEKKIPLNNIIENNIFYQIDKLIDGKKEWMDWKNNKVLKQAPEFWDDQKKQFKFVEGKLSYPQLKNFEAIDFEKIGYKKIQ